MFSVVYLVLLVVFMTGILAGSADAQNSPATGKPVITGIASFGQILTAGTSGISDVDGVPNSFSYQWVRVDGTDETYILGETGSTYTVVFGDVGKRFKVSVSFTDDGGNDEGPLVSDVSDEVESVFGAPWGVWSDGITIWVVDDDDDKVYAYTLSNNSHDSGKDIGLAGRHDNPRGAWSDGETMWVVHSEGLTGDKVYAYSLSSGSRRRGQDFDVESSYSIPRGIWSDNETIWVANYYSFAEGGRIRAYNKSDKSRHSGKDFTVGSHEDVAGIWSDGNSMWVAEEDGNRVYGYRMSDRKRDSDRDFRLSSDNRNARDIWSDGVVVYVSDDSDDTLYSYVLADVLGSYVYSVDVSYVGRTTANLDVVVYKPGGVDDVYVRYRVDGSSASWINRSRSVSSENVQFSLSGLDANTTYDLEVSLHDDFPNSATAKLEFVTLVDSPPLFSSGNFSVNENSVSVGTVEAEDPDTGDSITGYNISGGADFSLFEITNAGILSFVSAPDFEAPGDDDKNNEYVLIVSATGGSGNRRLSANQTVVVSVVDVDEPPLRPSAPVLSSPSSTSLSVSWGIPDNTGPSIVDYDVGYGLSSGGPFVDWPHSDASRSATITGLNDSTLYFVRVLARNAEGVSGWSEVSSFTTGSVSPPQVVNNRPVFTSGSSFSVDENSVSVGTFMASDVDSQDSIQSYFMKSTADASLFRLSTTSGVLSFVSAPNYEDPKDGGKDNVYVLEVGVVSGSGGRMLEGAQSVNITVVDVDEPPSAPAVPVLSSPSSTSLLVRWDAPGNTGPSIVDYDVGYGLSSGGPFVDWSHSDASRSATITGLNDSTLYFVRVLARNAEGVSGWSPAASFTTGSVVSNNPPVFSNSSSFSVEENTVSVGVVSASDSDGQDSVTGFRVSGGVDSARFTITGGGVLTFNSAPNYESPQDNGTDNVYVLEVEATSGSGGRELSATQSITVTVVDVVEAPSVPSAPVLSSPSSTSLLVGWSVPGGTGPSIIDYDVGYGLSSGGPFLDWPHSGTSRSATITGLNVSTLYFVRVLARNVEGSSGWSPTANFTTGSTSPPPETNNPPVFSSSSSFSVNENVRSVGVVVASDSDVQDSVTGYSISGGVDSARFSIMNAGVLTFNSAPNYESPQDNGTDNVYVVVVEATSGVRGRVRIASQSVTVTVNDVDERVSATPPQEVVLVYNCG